MARRERAWQSVASYSSVHDAEVHRISMGNSRGHELFMLVVDPGQASRFRAMREAALDCIEAALDQGCDPGEVKVSRAQFDRMVAEHLAAATSAGAIA